ncbi:MAG: DNA helicase RecG, partial [Candidatus Cloacimonetes bacterium]|nr:DNA helicase RecG [Candidatus Cloacimonadota bacterium]
MNPLKQEIQYLKGVGPKRAFQLSKLNLFTIEDILEHFPRDYIERSVLRPIGELNEGDYATIVGSIISVSRKQFRPGKEQLQVIITDGNTNLVCTWFQFGKWITHEMIEGKDIWVSGKITFFMDTAQIVHPEYEILDDAQDDDFWKSRKVLPLYSLTADITMKQMRKFIYTAFELYHDYIEETLPEYILKEYGFPPRKQALQKMHFLSDTDKLPEYRRRFVLEEFLYTQILWQRTKKNCFRKGTNFHPTGKLTKPLYDSLPYKLTEAQRRVVKEIFADMSSERQMNRLMQGDVG